MNYLQGYTEQEMERACDKALAKGIVIGTLLTLFYGLIALSFFA